MAGREKTDRGTHENATSLVITEMRNMQAKQLYPNTAYSYGALSAIPE